MIYAAELFGFGTVLLHIFMCRRLSDRRSRSPRPDLTVDVFVPTYNESVELVRETLIAACGMDYPHQTWLLDDGRRPEMRTLAEELGCRYLAREDREHAKAGNLNYAVAYSDGGLIAVFDADHAPRRDFLTKTLGYFEDLEVAVVQTPQDYYNLDSYQHRRRGASREVWREQALLSTAADRSTIWAITFAPLPQDQPVRLVLFRNTPSRPRVVILRHVPDQEQAGPDIHVYRVTDEGGNLGRWAEEARANQREVA